MVSEGKKRRKKELIKESDSEQNGTNIAQKIHETFNRLITSSPLFKHPSFISEKEYRLVSLPYNVTEYLGEPHFFVEEPNICFAKLSRTPLRSAMVMPSSTTRPSTWWNIGE